MDYMPLIPELGRDVLAIVDPPYGIMSEVSCNGGTRGKNYKGKSFYMRHKTRLWDKAPTETYFNELFYISTDVIIFGGNHFKLKETRCFFIWDKGLRGLSFADCEYIWTSFQKPSRIIKHNNDNDKIHAHQKPIALYRWILQNYAKKGQLILDTHSGSGSCACACWLEGYDFVAIEKDADYYNDSVNRLNELKSQGRLFLPD